jgi:hypothetical protein
VPFDPRASEIYIEDIAHALSMQCRWGGACGKWYSVAEHCVRVSWLLNTRVEKLSGLLHDAAEAYLVDLPRPIKKHLPEYLPAEERIFRCVAERFGISEYLSKDVVLADNILCETERRDLMPVMPEHLDRTKVSGITPLKKVIVPWTQEVAKLSFLNAFDDYSI